MVRRSTRRAVWRNMRLLQDWLARYASRATAYEARGERDRAAADYSEPARLGTKED
jgi:hypothetical protein